MKQTGKAKAAKITAGKDPKITPFLWFDNQAGEAAKFYTSIFKNAKILGTHYYPEGCPAPKGSVMSVSFELEGQKFIALNGGPHFKFTPAISFFVNCKDQKEVDYLWKKLVAGGAPQQCGWLTDKFGLCWQIVPTVLGDMLQDEDDEKAARVTQAMMQMIKLDIKALEAAYAGKKTSARKAANRKSR
jgi:predicted 3-demethylubiquinone-9 3-methyltransferase (glyoxalase superfamily)